MKPVGASPVYRAATRAAPGRKNQAMRSRRLRARRRKRDGMDELGSPIRYAATRSAGRTITARGRDDSVKSESPNKLHPVGALLLLMILTAFFPRASWCQKNTVVAGEFMTDPPTLVSLGFEWRISGDDNRNARVDVSFPEEGRASVAQSAPATAPAGRAGARRNPARGRHPLFQLRRSQYVCGQHPRS